MATVTKDFRIKSGLVVEGANATVDGSDIITEDAITGGTQTNISVTYDAQTKTVSFAAESGLADGDTDDLAEGTTNLYFTDTRAKESAADLLTNATLTNIAITGDENGLTITAENGVADSDTDDLEEGSTNLYFTDARAKASAANLLTAATVENISITSDAMGNLTITAENGVADSTTDDLDEGTTNKYFTDQRALDATASAYDVLGSAANAEFNASVYTDQAVAAIPSAILSIAGDTGTDSITLVSDTLTFAGGDGIDVVVTNNTVTVDIDSTVATLEGTQELENKTLGTGTLLGADLNANGYRITDLEMPDAASDAATKAYVDSVAEGLHIHASAAAATTANISIVNDLQVGDLIDGVTLADTNRVLVKNQSTASENGIYVVQSSGAATRALDFDSPAEVDGGDFIFVTGGNTQADTGWVQTSDTVVTIGTDPIYFTQFSGAGTYLAGTNLDLDGNTFSLQDEITLTTVTANLTGNVTGDVTGDVTGQVSDISNHDTDDLTEGASNLYFTDQRAYDAVNDSSTINFVAVELNSVSKQEANQISISNNDPEFPYVLHVFSPSEYRTAKYLVKFQSGTHTEVSEILLTTDSSNNVAITEYAVVGTNGSLSTITADVDGGNIRLMAVATNANSLATVVATLLV
jgi:hypothetical protein